MYKRQVKERLKCGSIEEAVMNTMHRIEGAYSLVVMSPRKLIAARDPHGFRPLCIGLLDNDCYIFASETCACLLYTSSNSSFIVLISFR